MNEFLPTPWVRGYDLKCTMRAIAEVERATNTPFLSVLAEFSDPAQMRVDRLADTVYALHQSGGRPRPLTRDEIFDKMDEVPIAHTLRAVMEAASVMLARHYPDAEGDDAPQGESAASGSTTAGS